jgi:hypothetical protein
MASYDLSRSSTDFRKRYVGVRMQQGRVLMDDDWNENERLHAETQRLLNLEAIGANGSPDKGFRIVNPKIDAADNPDFVIQSGAYYLGGNRVELRKDETYQLQDDWLQKPGEEKPGIPANDQCDLVYLEVWQQPVTAVEDSELLEPALGGPDTTVRMRTMHRVHLFSNVGVDQCNLAWKKLQEKLKKQGLGSINAEHQLVSNVSLAVDFVNHGNADDLCNPPMAGGYLGAENQAIRVQMVDSTHLTWGFDNAAPLYRVQMVADQSQKRFAMKTPPKDQAHWPLSGQIVEILPWSAVLANHEVISENRGFLARVDASYNPDKKQFTLATVLLPAGFGENWNNRSDASDLKGFHNFKDGNQFFYMRVWNRGEDVTSKPAIEFQPGKPVKLGYTGLRVTLTGADRVAGDFWIIAARPETPKQVLPWRLADGMAPQGIRRYYAPLALIRWSYVKKEIKGKIISDCRETFRPLTSLRNCCTWFVGDGVASHGDFDKIQEAVDSLPLQGGEILILPGLYPESITIRDKQNVVLRGCGNRTRIKPLAESPWALRILNSHDISVQDLALEITQGYGVVLQESASYWKESRLKKIELLNLDIRTRDRCAVLNRGGDEVCLKDCRIQVDCFDETIIQNSKLGKNQAVFMMGNDLVIENNRIVTDVCAARLHTALGGIQIGGGSDRVLIRGNRISGGNGNGITLGSVVYVNKKDRQIMENKRIEKGEYLRIMETMEWEYSWDFVYPDSGGCIHIRPDPDDPVDENGQPKKSLSEGDLSEVYIADNQIEKMGMNGIAAFYLPSQRVLIAVKGLSIEHNQILHCLQITLGNTQDDRLDNWIQGGIVLSRIFYGRIVENRIEQNGTTHMEPVCGIGILDAGTVDIRGNHIRENGPRVPTSQNPKRGIRGGIVVLNAYTPYHSISESAQSSPDFSAGSFLNRSQKAGPMISGALTGEDHPLFSEADRISNLPLHLDANFAACIKDNVVMTPEGRALLVLATGTVAIEGNHLVSTGNYHANFKTALQSLLQDVASKTDSNFVKAQKLRQDALNVLGGAAVTVINLGYPMDIKNKMTGNALKHLLNNSAAMAAKINKIIQFINGSNRDVARFLVGGTVMFNDNQVELQLWEEGQTQTLSSVALISLDDISMTANQCDCKQLQDDAVMFHGIIVGLSLRVVANRFREGLGKSYLSALTAGILNHTENNQGTYCFMALGPQSLIPCTPNRSLIQLFHQAVCHYNSVKEYFAKALPWLGIYSSSAAVSEFNDSNLDAALSELKDLGCDIDAGHWVSSLGNLDEVIVRFWHAHETLNLQYLETQDRELNVERIRTVEKYGLNSLKAREIEAESIRIKRQQIASKLESSELEKIF